MDDQHSLAGSQIQRNRVTRDDWESFAPHRHRVTQLLCSAARSNRSTLCVLGAGNGNDIDLSLLTERFARVTLVDLDGEALDRCLARLPAQVAQRVETIPDTDLSGILTMLELDVGRPLTNPQIEEVAARAGEVRPPPRLDRYDVVASCCLLTQLIDSVVQRVGPAHPQFATLALALRDGHLKLLSDLTTPAGAALLITDFVSSDTLPQLQTVPDQQLESLLAEAINGGNFFTGANPAVLAQRLAEDSNCGGHARVQLYPPWRWQMGDRYYGVCAVVMLKEP